MSALPPPTEAEIEHALDVLERAAAANAAEKGLVGPSAGDRHALGILRGARSAGGHPVIFDDSAAVMVACGHLAAGKTRYRAAELASRSLIATSTAKPGSVLRRIYRKIPHPSDVSAPST